MLNHNELTSRRLRQDDRLQQLTTTANMVAVYQHLYSTLTLALVPCVPLNRDRAGTVTSLCMCVSVRKITHELVYVCRPKLISIGKG